MVSSSGTKERWDIPEICPRCDTVGSVLIDSFTGGATSAKLKCVSCLRAWHIDPTPIHEVAGRAENKADLYKKALEEILGNPLEALSIAKKALFEL